MAASPSPFLRRGPIPDQRILLHGIPWSVYVSFRDALDAAGSGARLTYLRGELEITSPSEDHETQKTLLARLLEAWADECGIDLEGAGRTTYRREAVDRGLEPDECYCVGELREVPDVAIEVVVSRGLIDKLEVYRGLAVPEVWVYKEGTITVYRLDGDVYRERSGSVALPTLDLRLLASFVGQGGRQSQAVREFRARLRAQGRSRLP